MGGTHLPGRHLERDSVRVHHEFIVPPFRFSPISHPNSFPLGQVSHPLNSPDPRRSFPQKTLARATKPSSISSSEYSAAATFNRSSELAPPPFGSTGGAVEDARRSPTPSHTQSRRHLGRRILGAPPSTTSEPPLPSSSSPR